jgi:CDP-glycerol glycerophosphotransferase (TagB/SpsB family)
MTLPVVFFVPNMLDWEILEPAQKHLPEIPIATNNNDVYTKFQTLGKKVYRLPVFPDLVIMARHACHKFPSKSVKKVGMRHGAYHFKRMTKAENYNLFDLYFVTSKVDLEVAERIGVTTAKACGFPKIDDAFNGALTDDLLTHYRQKASIDPGKITLIFTSTWVKSGMSAFSRWSEKIHTLADEYNLIVTLHPWFTEQDKSKIKSIPNLYFIENERTLPYIMLADICIGDNSSIIAECSALNKPIVTFKTEKSSRSLDEIDELIESISIRVETFDEMKQAIEAYKADSNLKAEERKKANKVMFDELDGKAGERMAEHIKSILPHSHT